jgi:hypothetical protein
MSTVIALCFRDEAKTGLYDAATLREIGDRESEKVGSGCAAGADTGRLGPPVVFLLTVIPPAPLQVLGQGNRRLTDAQQALNIGNPAMIEPNTA